MIDPQFFPITLPFFHNISFKFLFHKKLNFHKVLTKPLTIDSWSSDPYESFDYEDYDALNNFSLNLTTDLRTNGSLKRTSEWNFQKLGNCVEKILLYIFMILGIVFNLLVILCIYRVKTRYRYLEVKQFLNLKN